MIKAAPAVKNVHPLVNSNDLIKRIAPGDPVGVKICGVTDETEARAIIELGAQMLGFNFWPKSRRYLGRAEDHRWIRELAPCCRVGVFVDAPSEDIVNLWKDGWIHVAQLHGDESPELCRNLRKSGVPVIKAAGIVDAALLENLRAFSEVDAFLVDAHAPVEKGGTGRLANWELARKAIDVLAPAPVILAGGLTPGNVHEAVCAVRPEAVDVASGVEISPGRKDLEMVRLFIERARGAE